MDFIIKFTITLFIFSILLLFFKSTKKLSENYYEKSLNVNESHIEKHSKKKGNSIDTNSIKFRINHDQYN